MKQGSVVVISLKRKFLFIDLIDVYLAEECSAKSAEKDVAVYIYSKVPGEKLYKDITYQLDLEKDESELLANITRGNRHKVRRAEKRAFCCSCKRYFI